MSERWRRRAGGKGFSDDQVIKGMEYLQYEEKTWTFGIDQLGVCSNQHEIQLEIHYSCV